MRITGQETARTRQEMANIEQDGTRVGCTTMAWQRVERSVVWRCRDCDAASLVSTQLPALAGILRWWGTAYGAVGAGLKQRPSHRLWQVLGGSTLVRRVWSC